MHHPPEVAQIQPCKHESLDLGANVGDLDAVVSIAQGQRTIEASEHAESEWIAHVNAVAQKTVYLTCNSWYLGANIPGKPRMFMPLVGFPPYADKCAEVARNGYEGFALG